MRESVLDCDALAVCVVDADWDGESDNETVSLCEKVGDDDPVIEVEIDPENEYDTEFESDSEAESEDVFDLDGVVESLGELLCDWLSVELCDSVAVGDWEIVTDGLLDSDGDAVRDSLSLPVKLGDKVVEVDKVTEREGDTEFDGE